MEGKFGAGLNLTNLTIAKLRQFSQPKFILAHDNPHDEYAKHEKQGPAEPPLTH